jgi:signal transduction histidine kinase
MTTELNPFPRALSLAVHEFRTPVTVVSGYLRMLLKEQAGPITEKQKKMLEEAERSCARIGAMVAEMSELGKLESGDLALARQEFDLCALLAEVASGMHEGRDRGVRLEVRGERGPLAVSGDRTRLANALRALMHAALRERAEEGLIAAQCSVSTQSQPAMAVVAIGDEDLVQVLSNPGADAVFDEWRGGLGLALPVARRVIEAHGGTLRSAAGERPRAGSILKLPLVRTQVTAPAGTSR